MIWKTQTQLEGRVNNSMQGRGERREEREREREESVQEESASLVGGSLLSALAPEANSTVADLTKQKTRHQEDCKARTAIAKKVAAAMVLGRQVTSLRREITRLGQSLF